MSPEHVAEVQEWLARVGADLGSADRLLEGGDDLIESALFHLQQAAEKALKAFLTWHDQAFPRTHNLTTLVALCAPFDGAIHQLDEAARILTPYVAEFRYPSKEPAPDRVQAEEARILARQVVQFVLDRLPPDVRV